MPAVWCTHSSLTLLQSFFHVETNFTLTMTEDNLLDASETRRVSGRGKGDVANHSMKRGAETAADTKPGWPHTLEESLTATTTTTKIDCDLIWNDPVLHLNGLNSRPSETVCCVVNLRRWVAGSFYREPSKTSTPLLTHYGVDTNSGEAGKGPPVALTNMSGGDVLKPNHSVSLWTFSQVQACLVELRDITSATSMCFLSHGSSRVSSFSNKLDGLLTSPEVKLTRD